MDIVCSFHFIPDGLREWGLAIDPMWELCSPVCANAREVWELSSPLVKVWAQWHVRPHLLPHCSTLFMYIHAIITLFLVFSHMLLLYGVLLVHYQLIPSASLLSSIDCMTYMHALANLFPRTSNGPSSTTYQHRYSYPRDHHTASSDASISFTHIHRTIAFHHYCG